MESELYSVATFIATKIDAKNLNNQDAPKKVISFLLSELATKGRLVNITGKYIQDSTNISKNKVNVAIKSLVDKGLVTKYPIKSRTSTGTVKIRKGKIVYSKYNYTLVINESLVDLLNEKGFDINFDRSLIAKMHLEAIEEVETELIEKSVLYDVTVEKVYTTAYDGSRTIQTNIDEDEVEQEKENARREYEEKLEGLNKLQQENGMVKSISPVEPLVDMDKKKEYEDMVKESEKKYEKGLLECLLMEENEIEFDIEDDFDEPSEFNMLVDYRPHNVKERKAN